MAASLFYKQGSKLHINPHACDNLWTARRVQAYIENKYGVAPETIRQDKTIWFDIGGMVSIEAEQVILNPFEMRINHFESFAYAIENAEWHKGYQSYRIGSWPRWILVFSKTTMRNVKNLIERNKNAYNFKAIMEQEKLKEVLADANNKARAKFTRR